MFGKPAARPLPPEVVRGIFGTSKPIIVSGGGVNGVGPMERPAETPQPEAQPSHWGVGASGETQGAGFPARVSPQAMGGPLGGSMRQPFDYDAAMRVLQGEQRNPKRWQYIVAALGDALVQNSGGRPWGMQNLVSTRDANAERLSLAATQIAKWKHEDFARQNEADLRAAAPFTVGRDRVSYDPESGQANVLYNGPEDFELYAQKLGLEPGTDDYYKAVEDYVLRSSGPSAYGRDIALDDHRTDNDRALEQYRFGNRKAMEVLRQGNRRGMVDYRNANPPAKASGPRVDTSLPVVSSPAEAKRLPSGTRFRTPEGKVKVVP